MVYWAWLRGECISVGPYIVATRHTAPQGPFLKNPVNLEECATCPERDACEWRAMGACQPHGGEGIRADCGHSHTHTHTHTHRGRDISTQSHTRTRARTHTQREGHIHTVTHAHTRACTHTHTEGGTYPHSHTHTRTHAHTQC